MMQNKSNEQLIEEYWNNEETEESLHDKFEYFMGFEIEGEELKYEDEKFNPNNTEADYKLVLPYFFLELEENKLEVAIKNEFHELLINNSHTFLKYLNYLLSVNVHNDCIPKTQRTLRSNIRKSMIEMVRDLTLDEIDSGDMREQLEKIEKVHKIAIMNKTEEPAGTLFGISLLNAAECYEKITSYKHDLLADRLLKLARITAKAWNNSSKRPAPLWRNGRECFYDLQEIAIFIIEKESLDLTIRELVKELDIYKKSQ